MRIAGRRLRRLQQDYAIGTIEWKDVERSRVASALRPLTSWMAHLEHGDTGQLRKQISSRAKLIS
jgi:hypothetical protein